MQVQELCCNALGRALSRMHAFSLHRSLAGLPGACSLARCYRCRGHGAFKYRANVTFSRHPLTRSERHDQKHALQTACRLLSRGTGSTMHTAAPPCFWPRIKPRPLRAQGRRQPTQTSKRRTAPGEPLSISMVCVGANGTTSHASIAGWTRSRTKN